MTTTRLTRRWLAPVAAVAALTTATACAPPPPGCGPTDAPPPVSLPARSPWAGKLCTVADQTPPAMLNGVVHRDGVLWMASVLGGEVVAADAATGTIVGRFGPRQGVATGPDDLVMADDGTLYTTGLLTGDVAALTPADGRSRKVAAAGAGVNPIALAPDGSLLVGHAYIAKGLARVDAGTGAVRVLDPDLAVNGFAVGPDGALYAPRTTVAGRPSVRGA